MDVTISAGFSGRPYDLRMRIFTIENNVGGNYSRYRGDRYAYSRSGYGSYMNDTRTVNSWIAGHHAGGNYSLPFAPGDFAGKTIGLGVYDTGAVGHDGNGNLWFTSRIQMLNASVFGSADTGDVGMNGDHLPRPPAAPTPLTIDNITTNSLRYSFSGNWDGGSPITSWQAQIATDPGFTQNVQTVNSSGTTTFTGLSPATRYYTRSRGNNAYWNGAWSTTLSAQTLPASAPGQSVVTNLSGSGATVTLSAPAGAAPDKFTVERRLQGTTSAVSFDTTSLVNNVTGLTPGATYEWRSSAVYGTYRSPWTGWLAVVQANPNTTPGEYFDGSTVPPVGSDVTYGWAGTVNNSVSRANGVSPLGWQIAFLDEGSGVLQRVTGGIYGSYGARAVIKEGTGQLGVWRSFDFELASDLTGWDWGWSNGDAGVITRTNAFPAHTGSYLLRYQDNLVSDASSDVAYNMYEYERYYDPGWYRFSAWVWLETGDKMRMFLDGGTVGAEEITLKNQWVYTTFETHLEGGESGLVFRVWRPSGAVEIRLDDVRIERIPNPSGVAIDSAVRVGQQNAVGYRSAVIPGNLYTGSVAVDLPRQQRMAAEIAFLDAGGTLVGDYILGDRQIVAANAPTTLIAQSVAPNTAAWMVTRAIDVEGEGWSPWQGGESFIVDGIQNTLAGPFPYFDGSFAPAGQYEFSWEGTPHNSISVRTTVDVPDTSLIDPDCVTVPLPPRPPVVPNTCIDEVGLWRREWWQINAQDVREWFDTLPTVQIRTAIGAERQLRIRYYANPFNRPLEQLSQDDFCGEIIISYLPADSVLTLDGITETAWASVAGGPNLSADHLLYGSDGLPAQWPVLECGIGYYITLDTSPDSGANNVSLSFELVTRY